jgi:hypothetical protein
MRLRSQVLGPKMYLVLGGVLRPEDAPKGQSITWFRPSGPTCNFSSRSSLNVDAKLPQRAQDRVTLNHHKMMDELTSAGITRLPEWKRLPRSVRRGVDPIRWLQVERTLRETDERMCRNIGVDRDLGAALMTKLWNRSFTEERDQLAEPEAKAQGRGQISRKLKAQLVDELRKATV